MILQEPKVEFVSLGISEAIYATTPTSSDPTGGGQYCIASMENAQYCANNVNSVDWNYVNPCSDGYDVDHII